MLQHPPNGTLWIGTGGVTQIFHRLTQVEAAPIKKIGYGSGCHALMLADFGEVDHIVDPHGEIIEHELNSPFVYLRFLVQGLSTLGNGEGSSEHVPLGAHQQ